VFMCDMSLESSQSLERISFRATCGVDTTILLRVGTLPLDPGEEDRTFWTFPLGRWWFSFHGRMEMSGVSCGSNLEIDPMASRDFGRGGKDQTKVRLGQPPRRPETGCLTTPLGVDTIVATSRFG
jgi:hypothetical protein